MAQEINGVNPPYPEQIQNAIPLTITDVQYEADKFAGLDSSKAHLQGTASADTSTILVPGVAGKKIVVYEVAAMTTGGATDFTGSLGEEGNASDKVQFTGTQYGQVRYTQPFELGAGLGLVLYRAAGNVGDAASDANITTVSYLIFDA